MEIYIKRTEVHLSPESRALKWLSSQHSVLKKCHLYIIDFAGFFVYTICINNHFWLIKEMKLNKIYEI